MKLNRESIISALESVTPGLATTKKEMLEQSSCFVFNNGRVWTYDDEICCSRDCDLGFSGAVKAQPILNLLTRMKEETIEVVCEDGELIVKGKRKKSGIRIEEEVLLPIEVIEQPEDWQPLESDFAEAIRLVSPCASTDENQWVLTCVHMHPDYVEACDRYQIARYSIETGLEKEVLVRADAIKGIVNLGIAKMCETESWLHFTNSSGLVVSCRKYNQDYLDLSKYLEKEETVPLSLPGGLKEIVGKAEIFSSGNAEGNNVTIHLKPNKILIEGRGVDGWYKEAQPIKYSGDEIKFDISCKLLVRIVDQSIDCKVGPGRILVDSNNFTYSTSTFESN